MFYDQVRALCEKRGVKITALARQLHLSPSAPNNWKEGSLPKVETVMKIAEYFNVSTDYLLYGDTRSISNSMNDVSGSAVAQGNQGSSISLYNGNSSANQETEEELLRIFRNLNIKGQTSLMSRAYMEEEKNQKNLFHSTKGVD